MGRTLPVFFLAFKTIFLKWTWTRENSYLNKIEPAESLPVANTIEIYYHSFFFSSAEQWFSFFPGTFLRLDIFVTPLQHVVAVDSFSSHDTTTSSWPFRPSPGGTPPFVALSKSKLVLAPIGPSGKKEKAKENSSQESNQSPEIGRWSCNRVTTPNLTEQVCHQVI